MAQQYENSGAIFVNNRKERDNHPDRTGTCDIKCPHCNKSFSMWVSGWIKQSKDGGKQFLSLAFTPKEEKKQGGTTPSLSDDFDNDTPF